MEFPILMQYSILYIINKSIDYIQLNSINLPNHPIYRKRLEIDSIQSSITIIDITWNKYVYKVSDEERPAMRFPVRVNRPWFKRLVDLTLLWLFQHLIRLFLAAL